MNNYAKSINKTMKSVNLFISVNKAKLLYWSYHFKARKINSGTT